MCTCNKEHLTRELLVYVLNSCGLVKVVKENLSVEKVLLNFAYTGTNKVCQGKLVRRTDALVNTSRNLSGKTCSSVRDFTGL